MGRLGTLDLATSSLLGLLICLHCCWSYNVAKLVPDPYLDEVFHIPQAQAYWAGSWRTWDPKITTPAGLYVYSWLLYDVVAALKATPELSVTMLRLTNSSATALGLFQLLGFFLEKRRAGSNLFHAPVHTTHVTLNIFASPLFFFFGVLYYTDVLSALAVVKCYSWYLNSTKSQGRARDQARGMIVFYGWAAMACRQTNVFWVAVFLGGLQVAESLKKLGYSKDWSFINTSQEPAFGGGKVYDPPLAGASVEDYAKTAMSLGTTALTTMPKLLGDLLPFLTLLGSFGAFVIWNGGVVLGDKENHVASLHLPQMLYLWPCMVFFSWPLLIPTVAALSPTKLPRSAVVISLLGMMLAAIHLNTIVHPFILADNRHYVFYVFRILLRHPAVRYAVAPIYLFCAWTVIAALGGNQPIPSSSSESPPKEKDRAKQKRPKTPETKPAKPAEPALRVSFVLVWLTATSLSLITAPLVELRYFMIPWLIWRLNLPTESDGGRRPKTTGKEKQQQQQSGFVQRALAFASAYSLWLETAWYALVNLVTCYVFLYRGFEWAQEPGKVQRFMW